MKINPFIYGLVVLVAFFGVIGVAKATGNWSVSGKISATGEKSCRRARTRMKSRAG